MSRILVQFYYLGPIILMSPDDFLKKEGEFYDTQRQNLALFLGFKPSDLAEEVVERYIEVTSKDAHPVITPSYDKINVRIIEPLRVAKKAYCFGDYIASIALCGIVGEMMAHVFYQINTTNINGSPFNPDVEKAIFGKNFERLEQFRRIKILSQLKYISDEQESALRELQTIRRPYMHWWNLGKSDDEIKSDAQNVVVEAIKLFSSVFNIKLASASSVAMDNKVSAFLEKMPVRKFYSDRL